MTSQKRLNNRMLRIDAITLRDHHFLEAHDVCFYIGDYCAGEGFGFSATNQLILNFKKSLETRGTPQWEYKEQAILDAARVLRSAVKPDAILTFVPVPPSKVKTDPLYDDRLIRMLQATCANRQTDVRELVVQIHSMEAAHLTAIRPTVDELVANYRLNETVTGPVPNKLVIVDDVLTTGCHFKAVQRVLVQRFPRTQIVGLFLARRVPKPST